MEPTLSQPQPPLSPETSQQHEGNFHHKKNIYPTVRHLLLILYILLGFCIIIFLIHQNGKSIYDNGI